VRETEMEREIGRKRERERSEREESNDAKRAFKNKNLDSGRG
jgi:hypothetical protein